MRRLYSDGGGLSRMVFLTIILDCARKQSATPLSSGTQTAKALSPLRFASAVQNRPASTGAPALR